MMWEGGLLHRHHLAIRAKVIFFALADDIEWIALHIHQLDDFLTMGKKGTQNARTTLTY